MAQPGKGGAQHDFAVPGFLERDLLDGELLVRRMQDGGSHPNLPRFVKPVITVRGAGPVGPIAVGALAAVKVRCGAARAPETGFVREPGRRALAAVPPGRWT